MPARSRGPRRAPAGADRQRDAERSRQALLSAALDEFSVHGFAGARVADIARRAGVNKQLINYYFGSKEGLYLALQRAWLEREESFAPPDLPLADLVVRYLTDALADPRSLRLLLWRGLADDSAPDSGPGRQGDLDRVSRRKAAGEVAADLDPAAVLLAGMGMVAAPIVDAAGRPGAVRRGPVQRGVPGALRRAAPPHRRPPGPRPAAGPGTPPPAPGTATPASARPAGGEG